MNYRIYTASGCARCVITKKYMKANGIDYEEFDIKSDGKDAFAKFYRANRKNIFRDENGVEFPVLTDGSEIRQGVSVIIGYLAGGTDLKGFVNRSQLHGEWLDGIDISGGSVDHADGLYQVLSHLKKYGLRIEAFSNGGNPAVLEHVMENRLADRIVVEIGDIKDNRVTQADLAQTLASAAKFPEYRFYTPISPKIQKDGKIDFITPDKVGGIAKFIETSTGNKKHPYFLRPWEPSAQADDSFKNLDPLPDAAMFKYRTAARRYMVMAEIEKKADK